MALLKINDQKENIGWNSDVIQIDKTPIAEMDKKINYVNEADSLYCFLEAICSKELFEEINKRFN